MSLFLLVVALVLLIFAPGMFVVVGWIVVPVLLAVIAIGYGAMWFVMKREKQERDHAEELREKARMMPTLYGP